MGVKRVVYASSVAVYGRGSFKVKGSGSELDEDDPPDPMGFYGMCKLYSENLAALYSRRFKLETVGLRPTSVFGVGRGGRLMGERPRGSDGGALYRDARTGGARAPDPDAVRRQRVRLDLCGRCRGGVVASNGNPDAAPTRLQSSSRAAPDGGRNGASAEVVARSSDRSIGQTYSEYRQYELRESYEGSGFQAALYYSKPASRNTSTLFANPPASRQSKHKTKRARGNTRPILIGCCSSAWRLPPAHWRASSVAGPSALSCWGIWEAVCVLIVSCQQDIVRTDILGQILERSFDQFERDKALTAENIARPRRQLRIVHPDVVEVTMHPVEPSGHPSAPRLEKGDAQLREAIRILPAPDFQFLPAPVQSF
jgi:NAD-dependent epimerase/dehydratase family protein